MAYIFERVAIMSGDDAFERAGAPRSEVVYPRFFSVRSSFFFESGPILWRCATKASKARDSKFHWMYRMCRRFYIEHMRASTRSFWLDFYAYILVTSLEMK